MMSSAATAKKCVDCGKGIKLANLKYCFCCDRDHCPECYAGLRDDDPGYCGWCDDNGFGRAAKEVWDAAIDQCVDEVFAEPMPDGPAPSSIRDHCSGDIEALVEATVEATKKCIVQRLKKLKRRER